MVDVSVIEQRIDRAITAAIPISTSLGGIDVKDYGQFLELAKTMATAKHSIPAWLRGSPGDCLMIWQKAHRWGMDPYFVAEQSYLMVNPRTGESKVGWQSQLVHALVETLAPIKNRLRHRYEGEGDNMFCVVWATFKGEDTPHEYKSEPIGKRIKDIGISEKGNFRGSPLWKQKPRLQLFYDASRDWARENCPDVLAGVYTPDELTDMEQVDVTPTTPRLSRYEENLQKLKEANAKHAKRGGFDADRVSAIIEGEVNPDVANEEVKNVDQLESNVEGSGTGDSGGSGNADNASGGEGVHDRASQGGKAHAGSQASKVEGQGEVGSPGDERPTPKGKGKR